MSYSFFGLALFVSWPGRYMCVVCFVWSPFFHLLAWPLHRLAAFFGVQSLIHIIIHIVCVTFVLPLYNDWCDVCVNYILSVYWTCTLYTFFFFFRPTRTIVCLCVCYHKIFTAGFKRFAKSEQQNDKINVSLYSKMWNMIQWKLLLFAIRAFVCV